WQVLLPQHEKGEMSARLVADAYWMPATSPSDGSSASPCGNSAISALKPTKSKPNDVAPAAAADVPRTLERGSYGPENGDPCMSPLSQGGKPDRNLSADPVPVGKEGLTVNELVASGFPLGNGAAAGTIPESGSEKLGAGNRVSPAHGGSASLSTSSTSTTMTPAAGGDEKGTGGSDCGGSGGGSVTGRSSNSMVAAATVQLAARTLVSNTINRKHGRNTNGAVVLKATAWGIEPRVALDKKTHASIQHDVGGGGAASAGVGARTGLDVASASRIGAGGGRAGGGGQQFLKFEAWSTRASAASSPWAAHPSMRRQA
ncbi:unnamed protein product, partial [Ectocarpus sp. 13 AM-2016]